MKREFPNKYTNLYLDTEFTGLRQDTTLVSLGLVSEDGREFYAEFTDYDKSQLNDWLKHYVIDNLYLDYIFGTEGSEFYKVVSSGDKKVFYSCIIRGSKEVICKELNEWLKQFKNVKIWSDCLAYDWVLFNELFGGAFNLPKNIYYIPMDICTLFEMEGIDPDISREDFINNSIKGKKHNSLYDAKVIKACYEILTK